MLFQQRFWQPIANGEVTLTFRRWKRQHVVAGNTYRTAAGRLVVDSVDAVLPESITETDAAMAGYSSADILVSELRGDAELPVYRVAFHLAEGPDPRDELAATEVLTDADAENLWARLERLDRASKRGPWTAATLALIAANPAVRAGDLAPKLGMELLDFKLNVRKLKNLGLTISLATGYLISPRGSAFRAMFHKSPPA